MSDIRAILFDMDGVLVNAKDWHFEALNKALVTYGYIPISYVEHQECYDGLPTRKKLALLAKTQPIPEPQFEGINTLKQNMTLEIARERCIPAPVHVEMVRRLKEEGYLLAVCSNSVRASVDLLLEKTGLSPFFAFTLSNEDVAHAKPHPEIYLTAMERFGISPLETLILEDNINGIQSARASGGHVLEISDINEVNYKHIATTITIIENQGVCKTEAMMHEHNPR